MVIAGASEVSSDRLSDSKGAESLLASDPDKFDTEALADVVVHKPGAVTTKHNLLNQDKRVQSLDLAQSPADYENSQATSATRTPLTPLHISLTHDWSLDPESGCAGMAKDLDDQERQIVDWMEYVETLDSPL